MRVLKSSLIVIILVGLWLSTVGTFTHAQDDLSPQQLNLLAQIDAAAVDQNTWQSYVEVALSRLFYSETLTISFGNSLTTQQDINYTTTTSYQGNPRVGSYNSNTLMTIEHQDQSSFESEWQSVEEYTLVVETIYLDGRLYMRALRSGGSENLLEMPSLEWYDITDDPYQYPALESAHLGRLLPERPASPWASPLRAVDFIQVARETPLRDILADIQLVAEDEVLTDDIGRETSTRQIQVRLNPLVMLSNAFAESEHKDALIAAFANENIEMSMTVWLDMETSRLVREQFVFLVQGEPDPITFGYEAGEVAEDGGLKAIFHLESEITYTDINVPITIDPPEGP